jgi:hypothetical protein
MDLGRGQDIETVTMKPVLHHSEWSIFSYTTIQTLFQHRSMCTQELSLVQ